MNRIPTWIALDVVWLSAMKALTLRATLLCIGLGALAACSQPFENETSSSTPSIYGAVIDGEATVAT